MASSEDTWRDIKGHYYLNYVPPPEFANLDGIMLDGRCAQHFRSPFFKARYGHLQLHQQHWHAMRCTWAELVGFQAQQLGPPGTLVPFDLNWPFPDPRPDVSANLNVRISLLENGVRMMEEGAKQMKEELHALRSLCSLPAVPGQQQETQAVLAGGDLGAVKREEEGPEESLSPNQTRRGTMAGGHRGEKREGSKQLASCAGLVKVAGGLGAGNAGPQRDLDPELQPGSELDFLKKQVQKLQDEVDTLQSTSASSCTGPESTDSKAKGFKDAGCQEGPSRKRVRKE